MDLLPVLNVMFLLIPALLLAMEVASFAAIQVAPPKWVDSVHPAPQSPTREPLNFKVFIMEDGFRVAATSQQQGASAGRDRDSNAPTIALAKPGAGLDDFARYDYAALEALAHKYKQAFPEESVVTLSAEGKVPLAALVQTMDALRGKDCHLARAAVGEVPPECLFWQPVVEAGAG